jgi:DNA (cytosine-5)-methyltransferase 1
MTSTSKEYTVVSLFSGGMGLDIGLDQTGRFKLLACVEKVPAFCQTIRANRDSGRIKNRSLRIFESDITLLEPHILMKEVGIKPGDIDLLVGGPPCQTFSTTGKRGTVQDPRGTLLWQFLRFVEELQPKMFVMENVRGLMSAALRHRPISQRPEKGGAPLEADEQPGSVIRLFVDDLQKAYRIDCFEVNAVNYGAPQLRERVLFIGNRFNRIIDFPAPTHGESTSDDGSRRLSPTLFENNEVTTPQPFRTLGEALQGLSEVNPVIMDFSPRKKKYLAMIPPGGNWRCLPEDIAKEAMGKAYFAKGGRSGWWRRLSFDLPSPTILTLPNHAGTALCHPTEVRALTLHECARVQEFPDEWEFKGTTAEQYAQVGNAVPVRLGRICGEVIAQQLDALSDSDFAISKADNPAFRIVYLKSHIRTRKWFKAGEQFIWQDGEDNQRALYGPAKTLMKVRSSWET